MYSVMRSALTRVEKIIKHLEKGKGEQAVRELLALREYLRERLEKKSQEDLPEEDAALFRHLFGWYMKYYLGRPPEIVLDPVRYENIIGQQLKKVVQVYRLLGEDPEKFKRDYEDFAKRGKGGLALFLRSMLERKRSEGLKFGELEDRKILEGVDW